MENNITVIGGGILVLLLARLKRKPYEVTRIKHDVLVQDFVRTPPIGDFCPMLTRDPKEVQKLIISPPGGKMKAPDY